MNGSELLKYYQSFHACMNVSSSVDVEEGSRAEGHLHVSGLEAAETVNGCRLIGHAGGNRNFGTEDVDGRRVEVIAGTVNNFRHD